MLIAVCLALASLSQDAPVAELPSGAQPLTLTASQIMARVHARAQANAIARNGIAWVKTKTVFDVENSTGEHVHETITWNMWVRDGVTWQQKMSKNGKPVKNGKPEPPDANLAAGLIEWYRYRLDEKPIQPEPGTGVSSWVIHFAPNGNANPKGTMEEVASRMQGVMYIDEHGFWIRSASGLLSEPYRKKVFLVPVATAQSVTFSLTQAEELGAVMTNHLEVRFRYSVLGSETTQRHEYSYDRFSLDNPAPAP